VLPSRWSILFRRSPLSLACGWPLGANGSLFHEWRRLQDFRVEDPSGARKGGPNRPRDRARPAGLGRPAQAHPDPTRSPLRSRWSLGDYALCPSTCTILMMSSSRPRWRFSVHEVQLTVYIRIKLHMDLQADKSPVVVKGPFFPRVVNPRYRIRGTMCNARIQSSKARKAIF
jgi:hypothetical protein